MRGFWRIVFCLLIFGYLAYELKHGLHASEGVGVVFAGPFALGLNYMWRAKQRQDLAREHREAVEADVETRIRTAQRVLDAPERRAKEGK